jgi:uncharacterized protein
MRNLFTVFSDKELTFKKSQLGWLFFALAPIWTYRLNANDLFKTDTSKAVEMPITAQAIVNGKAIKLEVSKNSISHQVGLIHRQDLPLDRGMLYQTTIQQPLVFNGKGMEFATDLIFIKGNKVVFTYSQIQPCNTDKCQTYGTKEPFDQVIETKTGIISKLQIANGTEVELAFADMAGR